MSIVGGVQDPRIRVLRFTFTEVRGGIRADGIQLAELQFRCVNDTLLPLRAAKNPGGRATSPHQGPEKSVDGLVTTKWFDSGMPFAGTSQLDVFLGNDLDMNDLASYTLITANDNPKRDPMSWTLEALVSPNNTLLLDDVQEYSLPAARHASLTMKLRRRNGFSLSSMFRRQAAAVPSPASLSILRQHDEVCARVGYGMSGGLHHRSFEVLTDGDVLQFGVAHGKTLRSLVQVFGRRVWGFDTFTGLPCEAKDEPLIRTWKPGSFSAGGHEAAKEIGRQAGPNGRVILVQGVFKDTLTTALAAKMRAAVYIDIDVDLYSSSWDALDWVFKNRIAVPGTVIGYDDFWVLPCVMNDFRVKQYGEAKAHFQIAFKHNVTFECICGPCRPRKIGKDWGWRTYFVVRSIGHQTDPGLRLLQADAEYYLSTSLCAKIRSREKLVHDRVRLDKDHQCTEKIERERRVK